MWLRLLVVAVVVGGLLLGCGNDSGDMLPLRSSVIFAVEEEEGEGFRFYMWTTEVFPCLNYNLQTDFRQRGHRIEAKIKGITRPGTCLNKEGPARYTHTLGTLSGTYELYISSREKTDEYRIAVIRDKVEIDPLQQSFTDYWE